ncbi:hypothetical protein RvY_08581 [Ramazzottius varieornatus]|uniref:Uncharacterized protein n=1 Tax=Ramazzottius varieornatus TaxID=947166 RepID=A0A1D1V6F6_RAMVA|nr:hypothetical protein RvY_08581 [Ramazzottius varieornatus]
MYGLLQDEIFWVLLSGSLCLCGGWFYLVRKVILPMFAVVGHFQWNAEQGVWQVVITTSATTAVTSVAIHSVPATTMPPASSCNMLVLTNRLYDALAGLSVTDREEISANVFFTFVDQLVGRMSMLCPPITGRESWNALAPKERLTPLDLPISHVILSETGRADCLTYQECKAEVAAIQYLHIYGDLARNFSDIGMIN